MPPLHPGDPGEGGGDEGDIDGAGGGFRPPLPPEDRLWRHPSEVARARVEAERRARRRRAAGLALVSGGLGAVVATVALTVLGGDDGPATERRVEGRAAAAVEAGEELEAAATAAVAPSVASVLVARAGEVSSGSAVVWREDGHLVTDEALVRDAGRVEVRLRDGVTLVADVVGADPLSGVAVLRVDADALPEARWADAGEPAGGDPMVLVAADDGAPAATVASGDVAAQPARVEDAGGEVHHGMVVLDVPFPSGSAGGALVDRHGDVVGIASGFRAATGHGVAVPAELVQHVAEQLAVHGRARHVWLGLHGRDHDGGALVDDVVPGGPAALAGVRAGDLVVGVDGESTPSMAALITALRLHLPGDVVRLDVARDGTRRELEVVLAAREEP